MRFNKLILFITCITVCFHASAKGGKESLRKPDFDAYMYSGKLGQGEALYTEYLKQKPDDDQARFEIGILQFIRAVERLAQMLYKFGPVTGSQYFPMIRIPVPENKNPETITYAKFRKIFEVFGSDMQTVISTLDTISSGNVLVPLYIGKIKCDINRDNKFSDWETFWVFYNRIFEDSQIDQKKAESFFIALDKADVHWLSGYCHLLSGMCDYVLSYDFPFLFNVISPYLFTKAKGSDIDLTDKQSLSKILTLKIVSPEKKQTALAHLSAALGESLVCFDEADKENDDDHEWIPNPRQKNGVLGITITKEMTDAWRSFLAEAGTVVQGKKIIPLRFYTDDKQGMGLNLKSFILDPHDLDLYEFFTTLKGPGIESGTYTQPRFWRNLMSVFEGDLIGYAVWFN